MGLDEWWNDDVRADMALVLAARVLSLRITVIQDNGLRTTVGSEDHPEVMLLRSQNLPGRFLPLAARRPGNW